MSAVLHVLPTAAALAEAAAFHVVCAGIEAVELRSTFRLALTGGSSAHLLYPAWRDLHLPGETHVFWSDERAVPRDDPERNSRLARSLWLDHASVAENQLHELPAELPDLEAAARSCEALLAEAPLDLVHLGLGPDGHVASLFPGHALLAERTRRVAALTDSPKPPPRRLTLTLRALAEARELLFTLAGREKGELLRGLLETARATAPPTAADATPGPAMIAALPPTTPVPFLVQRTKVAFFLDEAAASALPAAWLDLHPC